MMKCYVLQVAILIATFFSSCEKASNVMGDSRAAAEKAASAGKKTNALLSTTRYLVAQNGPDETAAFQSLINQSVSGDVIIIKAGNHYFMGTVHVNKSGLTIRGENNGTDPTNYLRKAAPPSGQSTSVIDVDEGVVNTVFDWIYIDGGMLPEPNMRV